MRKKYMLKVLSLSCAMLLGTDISANTASVSGGGAILVLGSEGSLWSWGENSAGQAGVGSNSILYTAHPMEVLNQQDVAKVTTASFHSMALLTDGTLMVWGSGLSGALGLGEQLSTNYPSLISDMTNVVDIALGQHFSLALKDNGEVWGWGHSRFGQIGENGVGIDQVTGNDITHRTVPIKVKGLQNIIAISSGHRYSLALDSNGDVWAWGLNSANYLGVGTTDDYVFTPKKVLGLSDIVEISVGDNSSMALRSDGRILAWGSNSYGELGIGTTSSASSPIMIGALENIKRIVSTDDRSFAFDVNGNLWAWGKNTYGGLGDGTKISRNTPVKLAISDVVSISGDDDSSVAIKKDGSVWTWGRNSHGGLGINDIDGQFKSLVPQQVLDSTLNPLNVGVSTEDKDNNNGAPSNFVNTSGGCVASYSLEGVLNIPCVSVSDLFGNTTLYQADLKRISQASPLAFKFTGAQQIDNTSSNSDECLATYKSDGLLYIPCVGVSDIFGGKKMYKIDLQWDLISTPLVFELTGVH